MVQSLGRSLVTRDDDGTLRVNFGKDLMSVLREVRYLKKEFPGRDFPEVAGDLFRREEAFRNYVNSLDQTVKNSIIFNIYRKSFYSRSSGYTLRRYTKYTFFFALKIFSTFYLQIRHKYAKKLISLQPGPPLQPAED